jgi:competence protein ComEA
LARAFGVSRETYDGRSQDDYREHLADLELRAAKQGAGIWAETNWEKLPEERQLERQDEAEVQLALDSQPMANGQTLNPNTAARDDLMKLPGVGEALANRIIEGRPFSKPEDLLRVSGIGPATLAKLRPHLQFSNR